MENFAQRKCLCTVSVVFPISNSVVPNSVHLVNLLIGRVQLIIYSGTEQREPNHDILMNRKPKYLKKLLISILTVLEGMWGSRPAMLMSGL